MKVGDACRVLPADKWCHRYDVFRIVVLDSTQIAELISSKFIFYKRNFVQK